MTHFFTLLLLGIAALMAFRGYHAYQTSDYGGTAFGSVMALAIIYVTIRRWWAQVIGR